jgi:hypothetical protein
LTPEDANSFRSIAGMVLYLRRYRPDASFCIKESAGRIARPSNMALQHLIKIVQYLEGTGNLGVNIGNPVPSVDPKHLLKFLRRRLGSTSFPQKVYVR